MKEWPKEPSARVPYRELIAPVKEALRSGYALVRQNEGKDIPYEGYSTPSARALPSPEERLQAESLEAGKRNKDEDLCDVILNLAFLLGYEQGLREAHKTVAQLEEQRQRLLKALHREARA